MNPMTLNVQELIRGYGIRGHFDGRGAPCAPYPASLQDVRRRDETSPLWEVPIAVLPILRLPAGGFFLSIMGAAAMRFPALLPSGSVAYLHPHDFISLRRYDGILPWSHLKRTGIYDRFLDWVATTHHGSDMRLGALVPSAVTARKAPLALEAV